MYVAICIRRYDHLITSAKKKEEKRRRNPPTCVHTSWHCIQWPAPKRREWYAHTVPWNTRLIVCLEDTRGCLCVPCIFIQLSPIAQICAPSLVGEDSQMLPLKRFQCLPDWQWPYSLISAFFAEIRDGEVLDKLLWCIFRRTLLLSFRDAQEDPALLGLSKWVCGACKECCDSCTAIASQHRLVYLRPRTHNTGCWSDVFLLVLLLCSCFVF